MIKQVEALSSRQRSKALAYMWDILQVSPFFRWRNSSFLESGDFLLIASTTPPPDQDFRWGWGSPGSGKLFAQEVVHYLQERANGVVIFEDTVSLPDDPFLTSHDHPAYWVYEGSIFWPALGIGITEENVEQTMAWSAAFRVLAIFSVLPAAFPTHYETVAIASEAFEQIASSVQRIAVDVFDGDGYLVWEKKTGIR